MMLASQGGDEELHRIGLAAVLSGSQLELHSSTVQHSLAALWLESIRLKHLK